MSNRGISLDRTDLVTYVKRCGECGSKNVKIVYCNELEQGQFIRTRRCEDCGYTFRTVEIEECLSDFSGLTAKIDSLERENQKLKERIDWIKGEIQKM